MRRNSRNLGQARRAPGTRRRPNGVLARGLPGLAAAFLVGLALFLTPGRAAVAADDAPSIRAEIESVLSDGNYQRDWPDAPPENAELGPIAKFFRYLLDLLAGIVPKQDSASSLSLDTVQIVIWGLVAAAAIVAIVFVLRRLPARTAGETLPDTAPSAARQRMVSPLEEIERLAREGRLEEAVHLLLLRFLEDVRVRARLTLRPAQTSREILAGAELPDGTRVNLARIVDSVEHSHFGGRPVSRDAFDACLEGYQAFLAAEAT